MSDDPRLRPVAADRHRETAALWSCERSSPLPRCATTGAVTDGIVEEIGDRLAIAGPIVRPAGRDDTVPPGWTAVLVGRSSDRQQVEVVYDPGRYDVLVVHSQGGGRFPRLAHEDAAEVMLDALAVTGWQPYDCTGEARLWVRDRPAAELQAVEHDEAGRRPKVQFSRVGSTRQPLRQCERPTPIARGLAQPAVEIRETGR